MATEAQITANRRNAEKCTGPRTAEGKAASSQNALKTGIDAKSEVIRCESQPEHDELSAEFYARFVPTLPEERSLVDMLIRSEWLCRRYATIDACVWERGFIETDSESLGLVYLRSQAAFDRLNRRINAAQRNYQQALKQLLALRARRLSEPEAPAKQELTTELVSFLIPQSEPVPAPLEKDDPPSIAA